MEMILIPVRFNNNNSPNELFARTELSLTFKRIMVFSLSSITILNTGWGSNPFNVKSAKSFAAFPMDSAASAISKSVVNFSASSRDLAATRDCFLIS